MRNIFLEKSCTKCGGELVSDTFLKTYNWAYLWINSLKFYTVCFYGMAVEGYRDHLLSPHIKLSKKIKTGLKLISLPHFPHIFWRETLLLLYSINWPSFIVWLPLLCEILGNMCIPIICKPGCDVMNFEVNLFFLIKPFFLHDEKVVTIT